MRLFPVLFNIFFFFSKKFCLTYKVHDYLLSIPGLPNLDCLVLRWMQALDPVGLVGVLI